MYGNKAVYIFDLDDTLLLHNVQEPYRSHYFSKITSLLKDLKRQGKVLCMVTYHCKPHSVMNEDIHLFDHIYSPEVMTITEYQSKGVFPDSTVWMSGKNVRICRSKAVVIREMISKLAFQFDQVVFFDDNPHHVYSVQQLGVHAFLVNPCKGIPLEVFL